MNMTHYTKEQLYVLRDEIRRQVADPKNKLGKIIQEVNTQPIYRELDALYTGWGVTDLEELAFEVHPFGFDDFGAFSTFLSDSAWDNRVCVQLHFDLVAIRSNLWDWGCYVFTKADFPELFDFIYSYAAKTEDINTNQWKDCVGSFIKHLDDATREDDSVLEDLGITRIQKPLSFGLSREEYLERLKSSSCPLSAHYKELYKDELQELYTKNLFGSRARKGLQRLEELAKDFLSQMTDLRGHTITPLPEQKQAEYRALIWQYQNLIAYIRFITGADKTAYARKRPRSKQSANRGSEKAPAPNKRAH